MSNLPDDIVAQLHKRRDEHVEGTAEEWDAAVAWVARSWSLVRPGGVVSQVMPDGKPFTAKRRVDQRG